MFSSAVVVPLFGFANAGVSLAGLELAALLAPLPLAVAAGLALGKQLGIFALIYIADRSGIARRPANASWPQVWGVCVLCGIGFTMSLFIASLGFGEESPLLDSAKIGILFGSAVAALIGSLLLRSAAAAPQAARSEPAPLGL